MRQPDRCRLSAEPPIRKPKSRAATRSTPNTNSTRHTNQSGSLDKRGIRRRESTSMDCSVSSASGQSHRDSDTEEAADSSGQPSTQDAKEGKMILGEEVHGITEESLECTVCLKLLYRPITTACGHTFCKSCVRQTLDHSNRCPICRATLPPHTHDTAANVLLTSLLTRLCSEAYARRQAEEEACALSRHAASKEGEAPFTMPMFVLDTLLPGQTMRLNVFEPRYRLMLQRVLAQPEHTFAMVGVDRATHGIAQVATEAVVVSYVPQMHGTYFLQIKGRRRCDVLEVWHQDGYSVGKMRWKRDQPADPERAGELADSVAEAVAATTQWMGAVRAYRHTSRKLPQIMEDLGGMPPRDEAERIGFWMAALVNPLPPLGMAPEIRLRCLSTESSLQRVQMVQTAIDISLQRLTAPSLSTAIAMKVRAWLAPVLRAAPFLQPEGLAGYFDALRQRLEAIPADLASQFISVASAPAPPEEPSPPPPAAPPSDAAAPAGEHEHSPPEAPGASGAS